MKNKKPSNKDPMAKILRQGAINGPFKHKIVESKSKYKRDKKVELNDSSMILF